MALNIVLFEPEIPQNTGNIMRLCANTGDKLHIVEPMGFLLTDRYIKRSGLDYISNVSYTLYSCFEDMMTKNNFPLERVFLYSTKAKTTYSNNTFKDEDVLVFGPESRGLPESVLDMFPSKNKLILPMNSDGRSLNLSNTVSVAVYEAWRQMDFCW